MLERVSEKVLSPRVPAAISGTEMAGVVLVAALEAGVSITDTPNDDPPVRSGIWAREAATNKMS